jgi:formate dehydrogenase iron-sulfur subunit
MAILVDTTKCVGCRGCQVACKQWNDLPAQTTVFFGGPGYQNPADVSVNTYTVLEFHRNGANDRSPDGTWNFLKFQCMHCTNAPCKQICDSLPNKAIQRSPEGFVYVDTSKCNAKQCDPYYKKGLCVAGCPFGVAKTGKVDTNGDGILDKKVMRKCRGCFDRVGDPYYLEPACVKSCITDGLQFGERSAMIAVAHARVADPDVVTKYPNVNVYGEDGPYGGSHVIYVLAQPPAFYSLPNLT